VKEDDKNKVATVIATSAGTGSDDRGKAPLAPPAGGGAVNVHKPGEGYATRLGMMAVIAAYVFFACYHFYYNWVFVRDFVDEIFRGIGLGKLTGWMGDLDVSSVIAWVGTFAIAIVGLLTGYFFVYIKKPTAEFLIKTDVELNKVTWPKITPWFKSDTLVWGSTYVVLIVVVALTVYTFGVDMVLQWISQKLFYGTAKGAPL
jgi:preprotein translocase subunit SecE